MSTVISVENISKQYRLGEVGRGTLNQDFNRWWHRIRGKEDPYLRIGERNDRTVKGKSDYVWALEDINFEVKQGEVLGIIGRNGAGKSTLLKILSKVTQPTTGQIKVKGRIASLLEVGTGFHPELSGRENIFLNGAILGMTKKEIARKFDEIVDFAGVERYIDTPVKRYSSGMYVRLAFGVAAHLEPEILIVDEVLAVGDAEFQKKCLGKMKDVSDREGRTVLFVSHNMGAVAALCSRGMVMANGTLSFLGDINSSVERYIHSNAFSEGYVDGAEIKYDQEFSGAKFLSIATKNKGEISANFSTSDSVEVELTYEVLREGVCLHTSIHLLDSMGTCILANFNGTSTSLTRDPYFNTPLSKGVYKATCIIPGNFLNEQRYVLSCFIVPEINAEMAMAKEVLSFGVTDDGEMRKEYTGNWIGLIRPKLAWNTVKL